MAGEGRLRLRLITMAWGEAYIKELFDITLAAALAPGNLPALAPLFDCDMVILTEESWFDRLRQHPAFVRIGEHFPVHLRPIDEFITRPDAYGMALTYALFRGFEEFGDEMVNVQLVFLNSDFVLADGSLRTVATRILQGERLILAPSYCVVAEDAAPRLLERRDPKTWSLVVQPRELAALTIAHRHNTIRAKTINQRVFSLEWMDQFYFLVDRTTMIARQFPIAVVSMRPERVLTDMVTFWDYGIVSEACPTTPRCVIADSDDFLMTELRGRDTARPQIGLGWPSARQIAGKLYRFITADPLELACHTLVLHAGELPSMLAAAKTELDRFVGAILAFLPAPMDYKDHYIWRYHYPTFQKLRAEYLAGRGLPLPIDPAGLVEHPPIPAPAELERAFETATAGMTADMAPRQIRSPAPAQGAAPCSMTASQAWRRYSIRTWPTSIQSGGRGPRKTATAFSSSRRRALPGASLAGQAGSSCGSKTCSRSRAASRTYPRLPAGRRPPRLPRPCRRPPRRRWGRRACRTANSTFASASSAKPICRGRASWSILCGPACGPAARYFCSVGMTPWGGSRRLTGFSRPTPWCLIFPPDYTQARPWIARRTFETVRTA